MNNQESMSGLENNLSHERRFNLWIKFIVWIPVVFMAVVIFGFSSQNGEASGGLSYKVAEAAVDFADKFADIDSESRENIINTLQLPIRKAAHMTEYAVLTVLIYIALAVDGLNHKWRLCFSLAAAFIFACSDELHQLFVPGRCGAFTDVLIDTAGAAIAVLLTAVVVSFRKSRTSRKNDKSNKTGNSKAAISE